MLLKFFEISYNNRATVRREIEVLVKNRRMFSVFCLQFIKNFCTKTDFSSLYLKLSLSVILKCFLISARFEPHISYIIVSYKKVY